MNARWIGILLVVGVAIAAFSFKLGQHSTPDQTADGIVRGVGSKDTGADKVTSDGASKIETHEFAGGGKLGFSGAAQVAHFEVANRNIKSIFVDGKEIWFATSGGVIRYDSAADTYKVYDNSTSGILSNGIFHVSKIGDDVMVGSYGGGLSVLNTKTNTWRNYNIPQGLADQFVYDVQRASSGDIWIATWSGVNRVKGGQLDDPASWETFTVENTKGGLPNPWVYSLAEGKNGEMWFATEAGLARYREGQWQHWQHKQGLGAPFEKVRDAIQFTNDPAKSSKHHAQQKAEQGLQSVDVAYNPNYIISLEVDDDGVVWCGTWGGGLAQFDGSTWRNFTTAEGLPGNHIFMLYKDPQGRIWSGTSQGLARFDRDTNGFVTLTSKDGLFADNVFSMAHAPDGSVWVGSFGGVARIVPK